MRKSLIIAGLLLLPFASSLAQSNIDQHLVDLYQKEAKDYAALFYSPIETPFQSTKWINHPYWEVIDCTDGEVCYDGLLYKGLSLRFNAAAQYIAVATPMSKILVTPDMSRVDYFILFGKKFVKQNDEKFSCLEYDKGIIQLWYRKNVTKGPEVIRDRRSYLSYVIKDSYIVRLGKRDYPIKNAKDIAKIFPEYKKEIRKYVLNARVNTQDKLELMQMTLDYVSSLK